jgi:hypothetical protein
MCGVAGEGRAFRSCCSAFLGFPARLHTNTHRHTEREREKERERVRDRYRETRTHTHTHSRDYQQHTHSHTNATQTGRPRGRVLAARRRAAGAGDGGETVRKGGELTEFVQRLLSSLDFSHAAPHVLKATRMSATRRRTEDGWDDGLDLIGFTGDGPPVEEGRRKGVKSSRWDGRGGARNELHGYVTDRAVSISVCATREVVGAGFFFLFYPFF